jgi:hypothetical protein
MRLALLLSALLLTSACGGDDDDDSTIDGAPGSQVDAAPNDGGDEPDGGKNVKLCGGLTGMQCEGADYCDYEDDSCGNSDGLGTCVPIPAECKPGGEPVCGCDGEAYKNKCEAAMAGVDVAEIGICNPGLTQ